MKTHPIAYLNIALFLALFGCSISHVDSNFQKAVIRKPLSTTTFSNLNLSSKEIIERFEKKFRKSSCDTVFETAIRVSFDGNSHANIPFAVSTVCNPYIPSQESTEILIKSDSLIRIGLDYFPIEDFEKELLREIQEWQQDQNFQIGLEFEWHIKNENLTRDIIKQSFHVMKDLADKKSIEWFSKKLEELSNEELKLFKSKFKVYPTITNVRPDVPS